MNKATNRRALAVFLVICLLYISVAFRIPERLSMKRITVKSPGPAQGLSLKVPLEPSRAEARTDEIAERKEATTADMPKASVSASPAIAGKGSSLVEPGFFVSVPIVCHAIKEGWVERETLIFSRKDGQNNIWLKPLDILRQQDESGVRHLVSIIGKNRVKEFLRREGVDIREDLSPEEMILGRGYAIEKRKLLSLYDRFVPDECGDLFPLVLSQGGVVRGRGGFQLVSSAEASRMRTDREDEEWRMPNLAGFPIKQAIDNLASHTAKIKVHGSGLVVDQYPKPFERLRHDSECVIYGRLASE